MSAYDFKFNLSKSQLFNLIDNFIEYRIKNPLSESSMTLVELIEKISDDKQMFDSWVNNIDVMN